jgi:tetratricopeptide (TPR) repeat protein
MPSDPNRVQAVFLAAVEQSGGDRNAYLDQECGPDAELRRRVEALLQAHDEPGSFLESSHTGMSATIDQPSTEGPGSVIGPYKLLEQIGEGGFGVVFMAEQQAPVRRKVALKVLKPGMDTKQVIARFEAERQALAIMDHPNIAQVHDGGATVSGRPYFVMELVKGVPITEFCDQNQMTPRERVELFVHVCQAVQHAHQKGIIHRDIKPSNVLVTLRDGVPLVKVIDFGIAKALGQQLTDKTVFTGFAQLIGTPLYMSPEQAAGGQDIDTRSDIYSLGVLLYELLTGTTPFAKERFKEIGYEEMRRIIREEEPPRPSTRISTLGKAATTVSTRRKSEPKRLSQLCRGELDWIVMKALEKDRNRRYESASAFVADVLRYLHDEPVQACPPSAWYRLRKFTRRNRVAVAIAGLVLFFLVSLGAGVSWVIQDKGARQAETEGAGQEAIERTNDLWAQRRWPEALEAAQRAEALSMLDGGSTDLRQRAQELVKNLKMIVRLEETLLVAGATRLEPFFDSALADSLYSEAFRDYGIDVENLEVAEAAERIRGRSIRVELATALDEWACLSRIGRKHDTARFNNLLAIARAADSDAWRNRLRDILERCPPGKQDDKAEKPALEQLAASADIAMLPPPTMRLLAEYLGHGGARETALALLRRAQKEHPNDFWINEDLALKLLALKPAKRDESVGYFQAGLALRPRSPGAHLNLAIALFKQGRFADMEAECRTALGLDPDSALAHNSLGVALHKQGKVVEAITEWKEAIRLKPDFALPHSNLGVDLAKQGKTAEAMAEYREAIRLQPGSASAHCNLGAVWYDLRKFREAEDEYRKAIRLDLDFDVPHFNLGRLLLDQGKVAGSIKEFREAVRLNPDADGHHMLGNALLKQGKFAEAEDEYREALHLKPAHHKAHDGLGSALMEQGKLHEAEGAFRKAAKLMDQGKLRVAEGAYGKATKLEADSANPHNNLGYALYKQDKFPEAEAELLKALQIMPKEARTHSTLGKVYRKQNNFLKAEAAFRRAIALKKDDAEATHNLGEALFQQGKYDDAEVFYQKAIKLDPKQAFYHHNLGILLLKQKKFDKAEAEIRQAAELKKDQADSWRNLGDALVMQDKFAEAEPYYQKAIHLDPKDALALNNLGSVLTKRGKLAEAEDKLRAAIALKPDFPEAFNGLGEALFRQHKLVQAELAYREAIRLRNNYIEAYDNLADLLRQQGRFAEEAAAYRDVIKLKPKSAEAYCNLGRVLREMGDVPGAIRACRAALDINDKLAAAHDNLGTALVDKGELEEAIREYRAALAIDRKFASAHSNLGVALLRNKDVDGAIRSLRAALAIDEQLAPAHNSLGIALLIKGDVKGAIRHCRRAVEINPKNKLAFVNLGSALRAQGDLEGAIRCYRSVLEIDARFSRAHGALGEALLEQGKFAAARAATAEGLRCLSPGDSFLDQFRHQLRLCEELMARDAKLSAVLMGKEKPKDAAEAAALAWLAQQPYKQLHAAAVRLYRQAFTAESKLADDPHTSHRYNAACSAVLAGCGLGKDAKQPNDEERAALRQQALDWLRADLVAWGKVLEGAKPDPVARRDLQHWLEDSDLAPVRDAAALAKLPEAERLAWRKLWADVDKLLRTTEKKGN